MPDIRTGAIAALCAALSVGAAASPRAALAQTVTPTTAKRSTIDAKPKGTIGLGILGAEVGLIVPALAGLMFLAAWWQQSDALAEPVAQVPVSGWSSTN